MPRMTDKMVKTGFQSSLEQRERDKPMLCFALGRLCSPKNIETDVSFQIDVRMVDLLGAFHFGWRMRIFRFNREGKCKAASAVETLDERQRHAKNEPMLVFALHRPV